MNFKTNCQIDASIRIYLSAVRTLYFLSDLKGQTQLRNRSCLRLRERTARTGALCSLRSGILARVRPLFALKSFLFFFLGHSNMAFTSIDHPATTSLHSSLSASVKTAISEKERYTVTARFRGFTTTTILAPASSQSKTFSSTSV